MPVYLWSTNPAPNATIDPNINLAAGRSPSSITPADRATLAAIAQYRDDIAGSLVTTGTSNAYILATNSVYDTATHLSGQEICFVPHVTNTAGAPDVTLTLDSIANVPIRSAPNTPLLAGTLIQGTPYGITYNKTDNALYLHGFYGNPYNVPLGGMMDYIGSTTPNPQFAIPNGQLISRTTYATLFAMIGTTYSAGDGVTTFGLPNLAGRVTAMIEATPTLLTAAGFGGNSSVIGAVNTKGGETETLTLAQLPTGIDVSVGGSATVETLSDVIFGSITTTTVGGTPADTVVTPGGISSSQIVSEGTVSGTGTSTNTSGAAHPNVQPTFMVNKILRII